ncbi:DUF2235 domain-containing protein [Kitasatospora sp. NPDC004669]|uniref:T6SS phospholipase effector Tle1-like catalytic domain-containing protein n=1 Tax=Kitasatospora sp. NPDC004669 TaxID=3154555 RepID=UPI0033A6A588
MALGLDPIALPHLRHNPIVRNVRHALALNECRAWFKPTTWGWLDLDSQGAMTRLKDDRPLYKEQDIDEVWFSECHTDVGGGGGSVDITTRIALRWMLSEAVNVDGGVRLNGKERDLFGEADPVDPPQVYKSQRAQRAAWRVVEQLPRKEIDNSKQWPIKKWARGSDGQRDPNGLTRGGKVYLHATAARSHSISGNIEIRHTKPLPRLG